MAENFNELNQETVNEEVKTTSTAKEDKKQLNKELVSGYAEDVKADPGLKEREGIWQEYVELVHTCGYGKNGNLIQTKKKNDATGEKRELGYTSTIVGYGLKNVSEDIEMPYTTEVFSRNEAGEIVSQIVDKVLMPGEEVFFTKKYAAIFLTKPEFSMVIKNARLLKINLNDTADFDGMLSKSVMKFNNKVTNKKVNDDEVKINISEVSGTHEKTKKDGSVEKINDYKVKAEYFSVFGGLDIPKNKDKTPGEDKTKVLMAAASNQVQKMFAESRKDQ